MNAHVAAPVQPLDQHFQTIGSELVPELRSLNVIMTEVRCSVIFSLSAPKWNSNEKGTVSVLGHERTVVLSV